MKLLLDECLPKRIKVLLVGHEVATVPEMGWAGIKNGKLLTLMEPIFDGFITVDGNMQYQQKLTDKQIRIIVLSAPSNAIEDLVTLIPQTLSALLTIQPGEVVTITKP